MIRVKCDDRNDTIAIYQGPKRMVSLDATEFGELIRGITKIMNEGSPALARKQERRAERRHLINQLKILIAIKVIDFWRKIKSLFVQK